MGFRPRGGDQPSLRTVQAPVLASVAVGRWFRAVDAGHDPTDGQPSPQDLLHRFGIDWPLTEADREVARAILDERRAERNANPPPRRRYIDPDDDPDGTG